MGVPSGHFKYIDIISVNNVVVCLPAEANSPLVVYDLDAIRNGSIRPFTTRRGHESEDDKEDVELVGAAVNAHIKGIGKTVLADAAARTSMTFTTLTSGGVIIAGAIHVGGITRIEIITQVVWPPV